MSLHSSNAWLQNSFNLHIRVARQEDGSFKASSEHGKMEGTGDSEQNAVRDLRGKLLNAALKGDL